MGQVSHASIETFHKIRESGILSERRDQVFTTLWETEKHSHLISDIGERGLTHNQIAKEVANRWSFPENYRHNVVARLCDLEDIGIVKRIGDAICPESGHNCTVWRTEDADPRKIVKGETKTEKKIREAKIEELNWCFDKVKDLGIIAIPVLEEIKNRVGEIECTN